MDEANGYVEIRENEESTLLKNSSSGQLIGLRWQVFLFISCLLVGQPAATLLTNFYYSNGGSNVWIATIVQSAGFPILIPVFLLKKSKNNGEPSSTKWRPFLLYLSVGFGYALVNVMYAYGLLYLPVSTFSLIGSSLLAFNAFFTFLLTIIFTKKPPKFTFFIFLSIFLLTASASLLAVDSQGTAKEGHHYITGIVITVTASAVNSFISSSLETSFGKVLNSQSFDAALETLFHQCIVTTCLTVSGLFALGEWKTLPDEMWSFDKGGAAYVITLLLIAVSYQIAFFGQYGLTFAVTSLFANMVYTCSLPIVPVLGVAIFHEKLSVKKIIALVLAVGGSLSYIYHGKNSEDLPDSCEDASA